MQSVHFWASGIEYLKGVMASFIVSITSRHKINMNKRIKVTIKDFICAPDIQSDPTLITALRTLSSTVIHRVQNEAYRILRIHIRSGSRIS